MKTKKTNHIAFYINGKRVSRQRIKLEAYIERHNLWRKAFLKALIKKSRKGAAVMVIIIILLALYSVFNTEEEQTHLIEKTNAYSEEKGQKTNVSLYNKAFLFISRFEGYHDKPYWDHKQWSCGYGMKCSKDTKNITREKSKAFVIEKIKNIDSKWKFNEIDNEGLRIALISFTYNLGHPPEGYKWFIKHGYINALKNRFKAYSYASGYFLRGLYIRRTAETELF